MVVPAEVRMGKLAVTQAAAAADTVVVHITIVTAAVTDIVVPVISRRERNKLENYSSKVKLKIKPRSRKLQARSRDQKGFRIGISVVMEVSFVFHLPILLLPEGLTLSKYSNILLCLYRLFLPFKFQSIL